ncbi:MAG TPA: efflux RND transporter periplasmic adaptor subunit [Gemmatimonadaceae bacterium]|nr:efflux RND transporter periplasmic adaptor subunit [Gemmatimonadaceae bacterium]
MTKILPLIALTVLAGCSTGRNKRAPVQTQAVQRRDIVVTAEANGAIEPIVVVDVRSKASGMITAMPVETGTYVKPGDLLAQIDTQTVQKQFRQAAADLNSAQAQLDVAAAQKQRSDEMLAAKVITPQENEQARLTYESAQATVVRQQANLDIAKQALEDATVQAVTAGTIIEKDVSVGQIIQSGTNSVSGGTTLLKMADLTHVRMRAYFNETDIGNIRAGEPATVSVDAFPDRRFEGKVEKIEPQAVVQQGVTMFPVLVNLENFDGALRPGMNGEVSALVDQRVGVIAVPNDALKTTREGITVASLLGLDPDSVQAQIRAQMSGGVGGGGGRRGGRRGRNGANGGASARGASAAPGAPHAAAFAFASFDPQQQDRQGGRRDGFQQVEVTDRDCAAIDAAYKKFPKQKARLDSLMAKMRAPDADRRALMQEAQPLYEAMGVDRAKAGACRRRAMTAQGGANAGPAASASSGARGSARGGMTVGGSEQGMTVRPRTGLVFVADSTTYRPRVVMLGQSNFDYTEVLSGLQEGEQVVMLNVLAIQAQRQQQQDRFRQNQASPLGGGGRGRGF